jgi:hypothetical protein
MRAKANQNSQSLYVSFVAVGWIFSYVLLYIYSEYLGKTSWSRSVSFYATDVPGNVDPSCLPQPLGVHFFGDFVSAICHAKLPSPYLSEFPTNYFPFAYTIMRPFAWLAAYNYWVSLVLFLVLPSYVILFSIWRTLHHDNVNQRLFFIIFAILLSQPFISAIDRSNIQMLVTAFVIISFFLIESDSKYISPVVLGLATAIKGYPFIYMLIFVRRREWIRLFVSVITAIFVTVTSLFLFSGSVIANFREMISDVLQFREGEGTLLRFNSSLKALLLSIKTHDIAFLSNVTNVLDSHYSFVVLLSASAIVLLLLISKTSMLQFSILTAIFCALFVELSFSYVLTLFFLVFLYFNESDYLTPIRIAQLISIAVLMTPKGISLDPSLSDFGPSLMSYVNPICMLFLLIVTAIEIVDSKLARSQNRLTLNRSPIGFPSRDM